MAGCAVIILGSTVTPSHANAQETPKIYAIETKNLAAALREFAVASGKDVVFDPALVKGKATHGVKGRLGDEEALKRLLAGSGLSFERTAIGGFVVRPGRSTDEAGASDQTAGSAATSVNNVFAVQEVVVTGTAGHMDKFTAPYSISTLKQQAIRDKSPRSLVDLFRGQPGINVENSGGKGGDENIAIRGLPYVGFRLIDVREDGLPLFESNYERFLNIDEIFRVDLMTERAEVERGGTGPIYSNNASGGVINLITRHGTATPEGAAQIEFGSDSLVRVSAYQSGPITDHLQMSMGGSYRRDDGLRDEHYSPGDDGGQFQVGVSYILPRGKIFADVKYLNDKSVFYTSIPLINPLTGGSLSNLINPNTGTLTSSAFENVQIRTLNGTPAGPTVSRKLSDGVHPDVATLTLGGDYDLGDGWTVTDRARFIDGRIGLNAIFNAATPTDASAFLASQLSRTQAAFPGTTSLNYSIAGSAAPYSPAATANLVMANNYDAIRTQMRDVINDVRIQKSADLGALGKHDFTAGLYTSYFVYGHQEQLSSILENVKNNPDALNINALDAAGNILGSVTENGFLSYGSGSNSGTARGTSIAGYLADTVHITSKWQVDAGVRSESRQAFGQQGVLGTQVLSATGPLAARSVQGVVSYTDHHENLHGLSYTFGSAYDFNNNVNGFARYTEAYSFPQFTTIISGALLPNGQKVPVSTVEQAEGGLKFSSKTFQTALTVYYSKFNKLSATTQVAAANGSVTNSSVLLNSTAVGLEGEADWRPVSFFELSGSITIQDPSIDSIQVLTGSTAASSQHGTLPRVPTYNVLLEPAYIFAINGWRGRAFADVYTVGKRFQDFSNLSVLPSYTTLDLGVTLKPSDRIELRLLGTNITDSAGLTEGNSRASALGVGTVSDASVGRPIFGRQVTASVLYHW